MGRTAPWDWTSKMPTDMSNVEDDAGREEKSDSKKPGTSRGKKKQKVAQKRVINGCNFGM
jgi:hypothetical protein